MKWLNLFKFGLGGFAGVLKRYVVLLAFLLGAGTVAAVWWNLPNCQEKVALAALELEKVARVRAESLAAEHTATVINLKLENISLKGRIKDVVPEKEECDLPISVVNLLNESRSHD